jgi:tetratricopeptide (TPR) repeat protein
MKRKERHHLKENDLAQTLVAARQAMEARQGLLTGVLLAVLLGAVVIGGIIVWQQEDDARAEQMLADAMVTFNARVIPASTTPAQPGEVPAAATLGATGSYATEAAKLTAALPKLKATADAYPGTDAGITARYHYASSLAALGKHAEAIQAFDDVINRSGADSLYGRMAQMGKADTQARAGQLNDAIAAWKSLASSSDEDLPKDAILMELGKAYQASGNQEEARKAFTQIIDEHPTSTSPYSADARAALGS